MSHSNTSIPRATAWALLLCLLASSVALAGGGTVFTPVAPARSPTADGDAAANVRVVAPAPPNRSPLDSEPIRHTPGDGASVSNAARPQSLELPRLAGAMAVVIGLIFLLRWGGKKLFNHPGSARSTSAVQVLSRSAVSPRQNVLLLRVGRRVIVVGETGTQMNPLSEITDPDEVAALIGQIREHRPEFSARTFRSLFQRAEREMSGTDMEDSEVDAAQNEESEDSAMPDNADSDVPVDPAISHTRDELSGLMEKVRVLSQNMRSSRT